MKALNSYDLDGQTCRIYQFGHGTDKISIVVLPQFSNINAGTHQFRFKVKANSRPGTLEFGYITDITDAYTFVVIESLTITNSSYNRTMRKKYLQYLQRFLIRQD